MNRKNVVIFRSSMLAASETFILSQGEGLTTFRALYFGARKVDGIEVPSDRSFFINSGGWLGKCREVAFKRFGLLGSRQSEMIAAAKPHLIHAHFGPDGIFALALARRCKLPLIVTFHGYDATSTDEFLGRCSYIHQEYLRKRADLARFAARFIAVSEFVKRKLMLQGYPEQKIVVHHVGVDLDLFRPSPHVLRRPVVLFVGRLIEVKGCCHLIKAMREVESSCPEAELVVIGDGPLRAELEHEAAQCLSRYLFLGSQPPNVVREWLNLAKVFCVPSVTTEDGHAEAFGIVFAEAQAMGVPVASFISGGIPEAVADGATGLLATEGDWRSLAANICRLLRDDELWHSMSWQAQDRVRSRFDLKRQTQILEDIYGDVLREHQEGAVTCPK
jgi:glycosyltransferase involved in cell wall biosynthesis